tara:strand:+ start:1233 stop:1862 length:630 start_codon:yes stop_codon:yes gene_type:complete
MAELNPEALEAHNPFQGPIPGQSLTNSEDDQQPWEKPPVYTNVKEAREVMFLEILKQENLEAILMLMNNGMSIGKITEMLLFIGYTKGQFTPDMMLLLLEPTMYMLLAVAESVGLDPKLDEDDEILTDEDIDQEDEEDINRLNKKIGPLLKNPKQRRKLEELQDTIERTEIPREIQERVEAVDFSAIKESLLAKSNQEENTNDSLLQRK